MNVCSDANLAPMETRFRITISQMRQMRLGVNMTRMKILLDAEEIRRAKSLCDRHHQYPLPLLWFKGRENP